MIERKIITEKWNLELYRSCSNWELCTKNGLPVKILHFHHLVYTKEKGNALMMVGYFFFEEDKNALGFWDIETGEFELGCDENMSLYMKREVELNSDDITYEDVPDTKEFNEKYEDYCKYSNKMTKLEYLRYLEFSKDHKDCRKNNGAIGGGLTVSFMGTGLGNIVHVKCENCGKEVDITDFESW